MSIGSTRKGITQAKFNEDTSNIIYVEFLIISGALGFHYSDWYVFGGMFIGVIVCMFIPVINILIGIVLSTLWALIGAIIVSSFQDIDIPDPSNFLRLLGLVFTTPASQVVGGFLFISGLGLHFGRHRMEQRCCRF